jgi:hypothetical protein
VPWYSLVVVTSCSLVFNIGAVVEFEGGDVVQSGIVYFRLRTECCGADGGDVFSGRGESRTDAEVGCGGHVARPWGSGIVSFR